MAKENNTDKDYLAFKSELIKAYSEDPERQKKWKIEGLTDIISIAKKSTTKEPDKTTFINKLESELKELKSK
tara:strand:- start:168 stop:383 length:216 start_codon:yes stop_codon:yes gene_type:complete